MSLYDASLSTLAQRMPAEGVTLAKEAQLGGPGRRDYDLDIGAELGPKRSEHGPAIMGPVAKDFRDRYIREGDPIWQCGFTAEAVSQRV